MTICAAAICRFENEDVVLVISDRMMTSGDIEFRGGEPKISTFSGTQIVCASAGSLNTASEIVAQTNEIMSGMGNNPILVSTVASQYAEYYRRLRQRRAEQIHLSPLGLDTDSFNTRQSTMSPDLVRELAYNLHIYDIGVDSIIAGVDEDGPHIHLVTHPGIETCWDHTAFVSIGTGARHFESLFMSACPPYSRSWLLSRALLLAYIAKKKSETAPNVGPETDIVMCSNTRVGVPDSNVMGGLETHYQLYSTAERNAFEEQANNVNIFRSQ